MLAARPSSGDQDAGISAIDDATCTAGGTGCFQDVCRYCKTRDTSQSKHFVGCPTYAAPATVIPIAPTTAVCASSLSLGDQGAGIDAVADASCKDGGTGCFADGTCHYCRAPTRAN